jgi:hypothetical protein
MTDEYSWEQLASEFERLRQQREPLRAEWSANEGSEDYGIWLLCPDGSHTVRIRTAFSLVAAHAAEKLGIPPIPVPMVAQNEPKVFEQITLLGGDPAEGVHVPYGLDGNAVNPCVRAWLELLRRNSPAFRPDGHRIFSVEGREYISFQGVIPDICEASEVYCWRCAMEEIRKRLEKALESAPSIAENSTEVTPKSDRPSDPDRLKPALPPDVLVAIPIGSDGSTDSRFGDAGTNEAARRQEPAASRSFSRKRRGRPAKIADALKEKALSVIGGTARARVLYQTRYPSAQQVKNVSTILRYYKKSRRSTE